MGNAESKSLIAEIGRMDEALRQAMLTSDTQTLDALIADDLIFTDHAGRLLSKQDDLGAHRSGQLRIEELTLIDQVIRSIGKNAAVVAARVAIKGVSGGADFFGHFRFTRVWAKRDGGWKVVAAHSSLISEP